MEATPWKNATSIITSDRHRFSRASTGAVGVFTVSGVTPARRGVGGVGEASAVLLLLLPAAAGRAEKKRGGRGEGSEAVDFSTVAVVVVCFPSLASSETASGGTTHAASAEGVRVGEAIPEGEDGTAEVEVEEEGEEEEGEEKQRRGREGEYSSV